MNLADLWELARQHVPAGRHFGITHTICQDGRGYACVQVHSEDRRVIERGVYTGHSLAPLEEAAARMVAGDWVWSVPKAEPMAVGL